MGSLPRTAKLLEFSQKRSLGEKFDQAAFDRELKDAVADVVRHQKEAGVDLINDGELGHTMGWAYDYGSWWSYVVKRLSGVEVTNTGLWMTTLSAHTKAPMAPKDFVVGNWPERRDMTKFQEAYMDPHSGCGLPEQFMTTHSPLVKGPIKYMGQEAIKRDIDNLKAGLKAAGVKEGLDELDRAGELRAHAERVLQDRRGAVVRLRRRDARRIQGDHRRRTERPA